MLFYSNNPGPLEISFPGLSCDANPLETKNPQFWHEISCQKHWKPLHIVSYSPFFKSKSAKTHHFQTTFGFRVVISITVSLSSCISHWAMQLEEIQTCPRRMIHLPRLRISVDQNWSLRVGQVLGMQPLSNVLLLDNYTPWSLTTSLPLKNGGKMVTFQGRTVKLWEHIVDSWTSILDSRYTPEDQHGT